MERVFWVEAPLGKLVKWLRILGFDTRYEAKSPVSRGPGVPAGAIRLTRSRKAAMEQTNRRLVVVRSNDPMEQLREVIAAVALRREELRIFTRCLRCNLPVEPVGRDDVRGKVPDHIWQVHADFRICPGCGRIYWPGTHAARTREVIRRIFGS